MPRLALAGAVALACSLAPSLADQTPLERRLLESVDTAVIRAHMRTLAARPHVAGTPAQRATADYVLRQMASWGLDTMRARYRVYLPYHDSTIVEVVRGSTRERLDLGEGGAGGEHLPPADVALAGPDRRHGFVADQAVAGGAAGLGGALQRDAAVEGAGNHQAFAPTAVM